MSYEFNQGDSLLNEFPNPFKFENLFLFVSAFCVGTGAVKVLLIAKSLFEGSQRVDSALAFVLGSVLLAGSVKLLIQSLSQMRFFYGRKFPIGLADELPTSAYGVGSGTEQVLETMRHRAIEFPEPKGALNGVLYSAVKSLITAPLPIQAAAVQHFHSVVTMLAILISLTVSYFTFSGSPYEGTISWIYLPMTGLSILTPLLKAKTERLASILPNDAAASDGAMWKIMGLVVFSIVAPALVPSLIPPMPIAPLWIAPAVVLIGSMVASAIFMSSLFARLDNVTQTGVSCEQTTIAMNCAPSQLWTALSRDFQDAWVRNIPNRAYANVAPDVGDAARGSFSGMVLEETQPLPTSTLRFDSLSDALKHPYARRLLLLSCWGLAASIMTALAAVHFAEQFGSSPPMESIRGILTTAALGLVTVFADRIGHLLWSRMQFNSRIYWIETAGTYQTSQLSVGNQFTGYALSSSTLTRVENATLRIWVADIVSVAFGKDGARGIIAMAPADSIARSMADRLITYARDHSSIATPTSEVDHAKAKSISALDASLRHTLADQHPLLPQGEQAGQNDGAAPERVLRGSIKFFDNERGFGFITDRSGKDHFFNRNYVVGEVPEDGCAVEFVRIEHARGPLAKQIRPVSS